MAAMGRASGVSLSLIEAAISGNDARKAAMAGRVLAQIKSNPQAKIAVWGLAFKDGTDDCRESPAMQIVGELLKHNANITAYDPQAMKNAAKLVGDKIKYASDMYEAAKDAEVLVILTEWPDFRQADMQKVRAQMKTLNIVDLRNLLNPDDMRAMGFKDQGIGR